MASHSPAGPDTLVTLKVNLNGIARRFKLPLRDLGVTTLEDKLRGFLSIPSTIECLIERYSDSAAAYVVLDANNISVYKQLYRAAKAKQKLKLRITMKHEVSQHKGPKPATVEDEPEPAALNPVDPVTTHKADEFVVAPSSPLAAVCPSPVYPQSTCAVSADAAFRRSVALMEQEQQLMERNLKAIEASVTALQKKPPTLGSPQSLAALLAARKARDMLAQTGTLAQAVTKAQSPPRPICDMLPPAPTQAPSPAPAPALAQAPAPAAVCPFANYVVCCNWCDRNIPDAHYHCSTCDDGDFDLCQDCVEQGITCHASDHWLIKRFVKNGVVINSTTETLPPKPKPVMAQVTSRLAPVSAAERVVPVFQRLTYQSVRTCNSCVQEFPETDFVHCTTCEDFDLCKSCFRKNQHGHHPKHGFVPAVSGTTLEPEVERHLAPGRHHVHNAICDGCEKTIQGIRHKCLDCPDWDYCSKCMADAPLAHASHRFVPIYEHLESPVGVRTRLWSRTNHIGICCDGPLCGTNRGSPLYIVGDRYKCAVCHDIDFCAKCEASPANPHNKTHPLIKFKTPVKHVSVTTTGEHKGGQRMETMGDRLRDRPASTSSRATETTLTQDIVRTDVVTVADVKPSRPAVLVKEEEEEVKSEPPVKTLSADDLVAVYKCDTVEDGTVLPPNHTFEQTWILRNEGQIAWPAGCSVKFVGGDYMGRVDSNRPAGVGELVSASASSAFEEAVAPGQDASFTVSLRTPAREGKIISYWRLVTDEGLKFGHRLWCDITVQTPKQEIKLEEPKTVSSDESCVKTSESQMIFPKLENESPVASILEEAAKVEYKDIPLPAYKEDFEDFDDEWDEADSDDAGFLTDEEYDVLDASDEEYLEEQQKDMPKN